MPSDFDDYVAPAWVDPDAFLFMGADPAWTPAKEYGNPKVDPDHRHGEPCILCHGDGAEIVLPDESVAILVGEIDQGSHRVCGRCMKYGLDHRLGPDHVDPAPGQAVGSDRPGYVVKGNVEVPEKYARQLKG